MKISNKLWGILTDIRSDCETAVARLIKSCEVKEINSKPISIEKTDNGLRFVSFDNKKFTELPMEDCLNILEYLEKLEEETF